MIAVGIEADELLVSIWDPGAKGAGRQGEGLGLWRAGREPGVGSQP